MRLKPTRRVTGKRDVSNVRDPAHLNANKQEICSYEDENEERNERTGTGRSWAIYDKKDAVV